MVKLIDVASGAHVVAAGPLHRSTLAWALADGRVILSSPDIAELRVHERGLLSAAFSPTADALYTGGDDGKVMRTGNDGAANLVHEEPRKWIDRLVAGPDGALAIALGREAVLVRGNDPVRRFSHQRSVNALAFAPKGFRLATAYAGGVSLHWAARTVDPVQLTWEGPHIEATFSPDGRFLITAMQDNQLHGWRMADSQDLRMAGYKMKPRSLAWSWKGAWLATSGATSAVLWPFKSKDGPMGQQPRLLGQREVFVKQVSCHPKEDIVAAGYADGMVLITRIEDGEEVLIRAPDGDPISALGFSKDGNRLAMGTEGGTASFADLVD